MVLWGSPVEASTKARTLDEAAAIAHALRHERGYLAVKARVEGAWRVWQATYRFPTNPTLGAVGGPRWESQPMGVSVLPDFEVSMTWAMPVGGRWGGQVMVAKRAWEEMKGVLMQARWEAILRVRQAYARWKMALASKELNEEFLAFHERMAAFSQKREKLGTATTLDTESAMVELIRARQALVLAEGEIAQHRKTLLDAMGWQEKTAPTFIAKPFTPRAIPALSVLLQRWEREPSPAIQILLARQARMDAEVTLAKARAIPDLTLTLGYQQEEGAHIVRGGLQLPLPIFDRNQDEIAAKEAESRRMGWIVKRAKEQGRREIKLAYQQLQRAEKLKQQQKRDLFPLLQRQQQRIEQGFQQGSLAFAQVLAFRASLLQARQDALRIRLNHRTRFFELLAAYGRPLSSRNSQIPSTPPTPPSSQTPHPPPNSSTPPPQRSPTHRASPQPSPSPR